MRKVILFTAAVVAIAVGSTSCNCGAGKASLKTEVDSISYAIGIDVGTNMLRTFDGLAERDDILLNKNDFMAGLAVVLKADSANQKISAQEAMQILENLNRKMQAKAMEKYEAEAAVAKELSAAFLAEKETEEGVVKTESGLLYKVVKEGKGKKPTAASTVVAHYKGSFVDGTVFESSYESGEPATFPLTHVIKGWSEGIQLMTPGAKYVFYIPSELAYGEHGKGQIPGNAALTFEVELQKVK